MKEIEFGKAVPYDIVIKPSHNKGFVVRVGCARLVFTDPHELVDALREYLEDPEAVEKRYNTSVGGVVSEARSA